MSHAMYQLMRATDTAIAENDWDMVLELIELQRLLLLKEQR